MFEKPSKIRTDVAPAILSLPGWREKNNIYIVTSARFENTYFVLHSFESVLSPLLSDF